MALPELTVADLAGFKGKEEMFFGFFAPKAVELSSFLVENVVGIEDIADEDLKGQKLFTYAVLDLAYELYVEQEYADININPFSSETIGSYSYSKSQTAAKVIADPGSSSPWMRLLQAYIDSLNDEGSKNVDHGGIIGIEYDGAAVNSEGNPALILGPKRHPQYFDNIYGNEVYGGGPQY